MRADSEAASRKDTNAGYLRGASEPRGALKTDELSEIAMARSTGMGESFSTLSLVLYFQN